MDEQGRGLLRRIASSALDLLYPERCVGCAAFGRSLCDRCEAKLIPLGAEARCPMCAARWENGGNCSRCFHLQQIDSIRAAFEMEDVPRAIVHGLKYRGIRSLAAPMARFMTPLTAAHPGAAWFPVPLHRSRLRSRGFNQADLLLRELRIAAHEGGRLLRERKTERQVGRRGRERQENVRGAFAYRGEPLDGVTAVLVDDVVTTGATVAECAKALRDHGARHVYVVAFARASYDIERTQNPIFD